MSVTSQTVEKHSTAETAKVENWENLRDYPAIDREHIRPENWAGYHEILEITVFARLYEVIDGIQQPQKIFRVNPTKLIGNTLLEQGETVASSCVLNRIYPEQINFIRVSEIGVSRNGKRVVNGVTYYKPWFEETGK